MQNPETAPVRIQDLLTRRELVQAESLIREKLAIEPDSADAHYFLGVWNYLSGKFGDAVESLKKAIALNPRHTDAGIALSVLFNDLGRYDDARQVFERANQSLAHPQSTRGAHEVDRKFAAKHQELGDLYLRYRRFDEAIDQYAKASLLDPTDPEFRIRLAKAYAKKGFVTRAIQELEQLKASNPGNVSALVQLGLLHFGQGNVLDAELEWESALRADPSNAEAKRCLEMAEKNRI